VVGTAKCNMWRGIFLCIKLLGHNTRNSQIKSVLHVVHPCFIMRWKVSLKPPVSFIRCFREMVKRRSRVVDTLPFWSSVRNSCRRTIILTELIRDYFWIAARKFVSIPTHILAFQCYIPYTVEKMLNSSKYNHNTFITDRWSTQEISYKWDTAVDTDRSVFLYCTNATTCASDTVP
jgi:hypothetical protein